MQVLRYIFALLITTKYNSEILRFLIVANILNPILKLNKN